MTPDVRSFANLSELSRHVAEAIVLIVRDAVAANGRCAIALAGGETPRTLYGLLASDCRDQIDWSRVHLFWGDERYVPANDRRSNYRMAREALIDHVPCPPEHVHPMPTDFASPESAADTYASSMRAYFGDAPPRFDLLLLGLGADGHTASLFPYSPALREKGRWVVAVDAPADPPRRLTLTMPVLTAAANIWVLVAGAQKEAVLSRVLAPDADADRYPAADLLTTTGHLIWAVSRMP